MSLLLVQKTTLRTLRPLSAMMYMYRQSTGLGFSLDFSAPLFFQGKRYDDQRSLGLLVWFLR